MARVTVRMGPGSCIFDLYRIEEMSTAQVVRNRAKSKMLTCQMPTRLSGLLATLARLARVSKGDGFLGLTQSLMLGTDEDSQIGPKPNPRGQLVGSWQSRSSQMTGHAWPV